MLLFVIYRQAVNVDMERFKYIVDMVIYLTFVGR